MTSTTENSARADQSPAGASDATGVSHAKSVSFAGHPCFDVQSRHTHARIHLPVAPRCNVQCNFCDRKYSCVNESRPGITASVMTPEEAFGHLEATLKTASNIAVVGIAGPGDPFANPAETLRTLALVRDKYPDIMLCVASNGLNLCPYLDELARLKVSHATITVNAVDPVVGARIYSWVESDGERRQGPQAAELLWENQKQAIHGLSSRGILVKVNTVCIPGVNSSHIEEIANAVARLGTSIQNVIPLLPTANTAFADIAEPSTHEMNDVRGMARNYLPQMEHCARCRADAVGLLAERNVAEDRGETTKEPAAPRNHGPHIAVASSDGSRVNMHLGEADHLLIYKMSSPKPKLVALRRIPPLTAGGSRWTTLAGLLRDCSLLLVGGIGPMPKSLLDRHGIWVRTVRGRISDILAKIDVNVSDDDSAPFVCGEACHGDQHGCDNGSGENRVRSHHGCFGA